MEERRQKLYTQEHRVAIDDDRTATTKKLLLDVLPVFRVAVAGLSDIGQTRTTNEDCFGYDVEDGIYVVCDGMGGMAAGEVASSTAVELMLRSYKKGFHEELRHEDRLRRSIEHANEVVWNLAQQDRKLRGMGTTLVAACIRRTTLIVGNVGDSRAYLLRGGTCLQITKDHSFAGEHKRLTGSGLSDQMAARLRQVITRAVGVGRIVEPDFFTIPLKPGDTILLTTDGLTRYADGETIAAHIPDNQTLEQICRSLIGLAYEKGAEDNITCLVFRVQ